MFPTRACLLKVPGLPFKYQPSTVRILPFGKAQATRGKIVTASQVANLLSNGYTTRGTYMAKLMNGGSEPEVVSDFQRRAMEHGQRYEPKAADIFLDQYRHEWVPLGTTETQYSHLLDIKCMDEDETVFTIGATPDLLLSARNGRALCMLEIKCPYHRWLTQSEIFYEPEASTLVSEKHYIQVQMQMLVLGLKHCFLFFYVPDRNGEGTTNYACFKVEADQGFQDFLISNIYTAYRELKDEQVHRFKTIRNEGAHNRCIITESRRAHCKFLIG